MEKLQQQPTGKKARVESPSVPVKQEVAEQGHSSGGASAMAAVAVEVAAPREELVVRIDKAKLHCPRCTVALKPPVFQFQCDAGHLACGDCHEHLPKNKCYSCFQDGAYIRVPALEAHLLSSRIPCPFAVHGCRAYVAYCEASDHQDECPWAPPCCCKEPGCTFVGSPPMLRDHLRGAHAWPVDKVRYGLWLHLSLSESQPRRLLDAVDDGRVFVVSLGARGATVACVRAGAAAGPPYSCRMWAAGKPGPATGRVEVAMVEADVASISSVPGDAAADAVPLAVPRRMLHGAAMEMRLSVSIHKAPK